MELFDQHSVELQFVLRHQIQEGNIYVAYPSEFKSLNKEDLNFFSTSYDAWEFCFENATDRDVYEYKPISSFIAMLKESTIKDKQEQSDLNKDRIDPDRNPLMILKETLLPTH
jgi:hypothetical protein